MTGLSTIYGMVGIGIAAAIGFVFMLSYMGGNTSIDSAKGNPDMIGLSSTAPSTFLLHQKTPKDSREMAAQSAGSDENATPSSQADSSLVMQEAAPSGTLQVRLSTIKALDGITGETIGSVAPHTELKLHKPIFLKAEFANDIDSILPDHVIVLGVSRTAEGASASYQPEYEQASTFRGNITANSEIALELYWKPETAGEYAIVVYSIDPKGSARDQSTAIESIPIRIVS